MSRKIREAPKSRARKARPPVHDLLPRYRRGEITSAEFLTRTQGDFQHLAEALIRGWDLPAAVDADDVAQELRRYAIEKVEDWDPARGDLAKFCIFSASEKAKKWLHQQRRAPKEKRGEHRGGLPSRYPLLLLDAVDREERESLLDRLGHTDPDQEEAIDAQRRAHLARVLADALGESVEGLSRHVEQDPELRARARALAAEMMSKGVE